MPHGDNLPSICTANSSPCFAQFPRLLAQLLGSHKGRGRRGHCCASLQHKGGLRALLTRAGWLPSPLQVGLSIPLSPSSSWAISWIKVVAQSRSNCPASEGSSENQHFQEKAALRSAGAQRLGPSWFHAQSLYSPSANNRAFSENEETVNSEVMGKKSIFSHNLPWGTQCHMMWARAGTRGIKQLLG